MDKEQFCDLLSEHNLTVFSFLDMKDNWYRLSAEDRYYLVRKEYDELDDETDDNE